MKSVAVLYHKGCSDGFGGAWAAWKRLGYRASYLPVEHQEPPPEGLRGKKIYLIDFCYSSEITKRLIADNKQVTVLDHHSTAAEAIQLTTDYRYDPTHSGAVLAWQYFHPGKPVPLLLRYVEDNDFWRFKLPQAKELAAFLLLGEFDFSQWNVFVRNFEKARTRKKYVEIGAVILRYDDYTVLRLIEDCAQKVNFAGYETLAVNSPVLESVIGHALAVKLPPLGIVWRQKRSKIQVSLRSDGSVDVAAIARQFGGGGHPSAAGFSLPLGQELPWKPANS